MSAGEIVLWRHGRTAYNAAGRLQGQVDIALDDVGLWQAARGAEALARRFEPARIMTSDLQRAATTAAALAQASGADVVVDKRLRERSFGLWEGMTGAEMSERWPEDYAAWTRGEEPTTIGAETRADVGERMAEAIADGAGALDRDETLLVVSHGAAISLAITTLLGLDPAGWKGIQGMHNAHWSVLHAGSGNPSWRLTAHNVGPDFPLDHWNAGPDWKLQASSV